MVEWEANRPYGAKTTLEQAKEQVNILFLSALLALGGQEAWQMAVFLVEALVYCFEDLQLLILEHNWRSPCTPFTSIKADFLMP